MIGINTPIDTNKDDIAVAEANKLGIPVIGVIDSNSNPNGIDYPIPGNDDALRAIQLYCDLVASAVFAGLQSEVTESGGDLGEAESAPGEDLSLKTESSDNTPEVTPVEKGVDEKPPEEGTEAKPPEELTQEKPGNTPTG